MDALERAKKRLLGESQVASGPSQALGPDAPPDDDRMAQARARLEQEPPTHALQTRLHAVPAEDTVSLPADEVAITDVPEAVEEKPDEPLSQEQLFAYYKDRLPDLFTEDGLIADFDMAEEIGILTKISLVPEDTPQEKIASHSSSISTTSPYRYIYNDPLNARDIVANNVESERRASLSRTELSAEKRAEEDAILADQAAEMGLSEEDYVEQELIPEFIKNNEKDSPYLTGFFKFMNEYGLGSETMTTLNGLGTGIGYIGDSFQDGVQAMAEGLQNTNPELYDTMTTAITGGKQDPKTFAEGAGREAMNFITFTESIPLLGITGKAGAIGTGAAKLTTKTQRQSIQAADDLRSAIKEHAGATDKAAEVAASKKIVAAKERLSASVAKEIDETDALKAKAKEKAVKAADKAWNRRLNISKAKGATAEEAAKRADEAARVAEANQDVAEDLIILFEAETGKTISRTGADGRLKIDFDKARKAGVETAEEVAEAQRGTVREFLTGDASVQLHGLSELAGQGEKITSPLLKPEKFDGLVAIVSDLKKRNPDAFKKKIHKEGPRKGKEYTTIDHLFELTVNEELLKSDELIDMLNRYGLSFEDYVLTVVGSGSEAGKILNKLSQIKRLRPANEMIALQEKATVNAQGVIRKAIMRTENIRRGGLVSQIATAARNLQSGGIRAPLEGFGNVMDTALYNASEKGGIRGVAAGAKSMLSANNWRDSFRHMKYMFDPNVVSDTRQYVDFILDRPELAGQFDLMFNNINEIQRLVGRGEATTTLGKGADAVATALEDAVDVLNTPNRWQEHLIRRGAFLGELERLVKREYGIDLIDAINDGKIRDLLNDAGSVRPKDARSFISIVEDATQKALDITYAKQPDVPVFRSTSQFIVRNGLTVVLPFPRFMFNSMELMGQYMGGASIPLARKMASVVTMGRFGGGKLTAKDRQRISRNFVGSGTLPFLLKDDPEEKKEDKGAIDYAADFLLGMSVVGAAYQYRTSDEAPSDYKLLKTGDDTVMDTTPQYPMRQFMYLGEAVRRINNGTFSDFFKSKEFTETFLGTNIREGVGQSIIQEVADLASGVDLTDEEQAGRILGRTLGNYLSTWAVPFAQIIEAERVEGVRGLEYKDAAEDPTLDFQSTFMRELSRPFARFKSPDEEAALPKREFLFAEDKQRVAPLFRVLGGINLATIDDEYGEYISSFGYTDYELGSRSKVPSIRRFENSVVRDALPGIVEGAKRYEQSLRRKYQDASDAVKEEFTEEKYVSSRMRMFIKKKIKRVRNRVSKGKVLTADAPVYAEAMLKYRRLSKETRTAASVKFVEKYGREPDGVDEKDINRLLLIGKAYDRAMR